MKIKFEFVPALSAIWVLCAGATVKVEGQSVSATSANTPPTNAFAQAEQQHKESGTDMVIPIIEMHDVPIHTAIQNFARQGKINYQIDPRLSQWWERLDAGDTKTHEPILTICWTNLTAKQALLGLLNNYNLVLAEDPLTSISRITYTNQTLDPRDFRLLCDDTNNIPLIQFGDVPITTALENFGRIANINYVLDPKIGYGIPDEKGNIKIEPTLSIRWENVTAKQAFIAICENYNLIITKSSQPDIILIKSKK